MERDETARAVSGARGQRENAGRTLTRPVDFSENGSCHTHDNTYRRAHTGAHNAHRQSRPYAGADR
eukprot:10526298-Lingulodinium_polyedra.AAC.1